MRGKDLERGGGEVAAVQDFVDVIGVKVDDRVEPLGVLGVVLHMKVQEVSALGGLFAAGREFRVVNSLGFADEHIADTGGVVLAHALLEGCDVRAERSLGARAELLFVSGRAGLERVGQLRGDRARAEQRQLVLGGEQRGAHPVAPLRVVRGRVVSGRGRRWGHARGWSCDRFALRDNNRDRVNGGGGVDVKVLHDIGRFNLQGLLGLRLEASLVASPLLGLYAIPVFRHERDVRVDFPLVRRSCGFRFEYYLNII